MTRRESVDKWAHMSMEERTELYLFYREKFGSDWSYNTFSRSNTMIHLTMDYDDITQQEDEEAQMSKV